MACEEHGRVCTTIEYINKRIEEFQTEYNRFVGATEAKFNDTTKEMKELRKEIMDEMKSNFKDLRDYIDNKETKANDKKWLIISSIATPTLLVILQQILSKLIK